MYYSLSIQQTKIPTFHYTRRITPKRVTSLRCPSPCHSARQHSYGSY